ncbi:PLD-like domain-containing protein [Natronincola peptidivorans]|uniref:PLD-like domain-containing protein n=1 Tax=Natronincola peptidivorans TaxID=426128 RepID=A0A1I0ELK5_9FIRM|nr:phospholipase D family protein [Natronincola peptidivorans]SET46120.1 PLD-like domain-containing protein [Natronincola peptidivorans]
MFYIQDGRFSGSLTTHEAILTAATSTQNMLDYGAGVFAFATSGGTSLIFEDQVIRDFLSNNPFTLIVGIDDITNTNTLNKLRELRDLYQPNLEVKVFCDNDSGSLFHPKFIWFKVDGELRLIVGSGNLTEKGLRRNKEAFTINNLTNDELNDFEEYWNLWVSQNNDKLRDLDDEEVIRRAARNATRFARGRRLELELEMEEEEDTPCEVRNEPLITEPVNDEVIPIEVVDTDTPFVPEILDAEDYGAWTIEDNLEVLIAEIPNSGNRWKQANFNRAVFEGFFGGIAGVNEERRILLRNVSITGILEELEVRPTVSVRSQNYRVELAAASGIEYPEGDNRPIGIFIKVATRSFIYSLIMPDHDIYNEVIVYLNNYQPRVGIRMRRYLTDVEDLRENCPNLNFWLI